MNDRRTAFDRYKVFIPVALLVGASVFLSGEEGCGGQDTTGEGGYMWQKLKKESDDGDDFFTRPIGGIDGGPAVSGGSGPFWIGLWREPNCSLMQGAVDSSPKVVATSANYQDLVHALAGSATTADQFSGGCTPVTTGISSQFGAIAGNFSNGNVAVANVSNDGFQVTVVNSASGAVISQTDYPTLSATELNSDGAAVFGIASADLNGDGVPDIVVANLTNQGTDTVSLAVFLGKGDGTFTAGQVLSVPMNSNTGNTGPVIGVTIADVNNDKKLDLVAVTNSTGPGVTVFLGNGDGTFAGSGIAGPAGSGGQNLVVADFNNDGNPDIATSYGQILLGHGDGSFTLLPQTLPETQAALTAADFNHDGKIDLAFSSNGAYVDEYFGNGDGTFTYVASYPQIQGGYSIQSSDLDGDGYADLFVGTAQGGAFTSDPSTDGLSQALLNLGDGTFGTSRAYFTGTRLYDVADFHGDGKLDLVSVGHADGTGEGLAGAGSGAPVLAVLAGVGDGTFATQAIRTALSGPSSTQDVLALAAGDVNGDGKGDVVFAYGLTGSGETPTLAVSLGNGDGSFQAPQNYASPGSVASNGFASTTTRTLLLTDVNGDGKPDIVFIASPDGSISAATGLYVMLNNGNGSFAAAQPIDAEPYMSYLAAEDLNGDGHTDLVVTSIGVPGGSPNGAAYLYLGKGNGTFQAATSLNPGSPYPNAVAIADMNGDGKPDLVFAGTDSASNGSVTVLLGNGDGTFQAGVNSAAAGTNGLVVIDFNGDGKPDVVLGGMFPYFMAGAGDGTLSASNYGFLGLAPNSANLVTANLTGSKLGDLLLTSDSTIEVFVAAKLVATATPGFQLSVSPASGQASSSTPATTTVTVTPQNGFSSAVTLGCTGLPAGVSCKFTPASVTPNGAAVTSSLSISVASMAGTGSAGGQGAARSGAIMFAASQQPILALTMLLGCVGACFAGLAGARCLPRPRLVLASCSLGALILVGCGGGGSSSSAGSSGSSSGSSSSGSSSSGGTQPSTVTIQITGSAANNVTGSVSYTLTITG
jgi:hypothetical protein